ncbi:hypothetical protein T06_3648 [Trichinella sp. T6]|nr:hypothetical protein T06_3648 [Trichinella sp. T6]
MSFSKKYLINCVRWILILWAYFPSISQATSKCQNQNAGGAGDVDCSCTTQRKDTACRCCWWKLGKQPSGSYSK